MFSPTLLSCSTASCALYNRIEHSRGFLICLILPIGYCFQTAVGRKESDVNVLKTFYFLFAQKFAISSKIRAISFPGPSPLPPWRWENDPGFGLSSGHLGFKRYKRERVSGSPVKQKKVISWVIAILSHTQANAPLKFPSSILICDYIQRIKVSS